MLRANFVTVPDRSLVQSMADTQAAAATGSPAPLSHLPESSEELAAMATLEISVGGTLLKLHREVMASGSRVLRQALCCCGDGGSDSAAAASQAAAVQAAFEGHDQHAVHTFLKLLYNQTVVDEIPAGASVWPELLALADKLDAPAVLQASQGCKCCQ